VGKFWSNTIKEKLSFVNGKKLFMMNLPYVIVFYLADKVAWLYRHCIGESLVEKLGVLFLNFSLAFDNPFPSFQIYDMGMGILGAVLVKLAVYLKGKNAKKYRQGVEYGSARWSA
jgi:type IV secretion system protein VirD4